MAQLSDLPTELIALILTHIHSSRSLHQVSFVCSAFALISRPILARRYENDDPKQPFRPFLRSICQRPDIGAHVKTARIRSWATESSIMPGGWYIPTPPAEWEKVLFFAAARKTGVISDVHWNRQIAKGVENAEVILLISLLPNLEELHLDFPITDRAGFAHGQLSWSYLTANGGLQKLKRLYVRRPQVTNWDSVGPTGFTGKKIELYHLRHFFGLPRLAMMYLEGVEGTNASADIIEAEVQKAGWEGAKDGEGAKGAAVVKRDRSLYISNSVLSPAAFATLRHYYGFEFVNDRF